MEKIIAVNAGSSSLKFKLYDMPEEKVIASGIYERIGLEDGIFKKIVQNLCKTGVHPKIWTRREHTWN